MRLIDADAMNEELFYKQLGGKDTLITAECAFNMINEQPTVEAKPVVHGEWDKKIMNYCCSQCTTAFYDNLAWITDEFKLPNFCPNCGADMRGEKNG